MKSIKLSIIASLLMLMVGCEMEKADVATDIEVQKCYRLYNGNFNKTLLDSAEGNIKGRNIYDMYVYTDVEQVSFFTAINNVGCSMAKHENFVDRSGTNDAGVFIYDFEFDIAVDVDPVTGDTIYEHYAVYANNDRDPIYPDDGSAPYYSPRTLTVSDKASGNMIFRAPLIEVRTTKRSY